MKKTIFNTLLGLASLSLILGVIRIIYVIQHDFLKDYEFNTEYAINILIGISILVVCNLLGNMIHYLVKGNK